MAQFLSEGLTVKFDNQQHCDVAFMVEGKCINAHKIVLAVRSEVLGELSQGWSPDLDPIPIETIDYASFKALLRYLYSGEIALSKDKVFIFMSAAVHFKVDDLEKKCVHHIERSMDLANVCQLMNEAVLFNSTLLQEKCFELFKSKTNEVLQSSSFTRLSQHALSVLLEADEVNVIESVLFFWIRKWMEAACHQENLVINGENMRQVIGDALFKIRFPTMTAQDFANCVTTIDGFLTDSEMRTTFQKIMVFKNDKIECPFPSEFRCRYSTTYSPFRDMNQLLQKEVLFEVNGKQCFDAEALACHIKDLNAGKLFPPSFGLLLQCCADMINSSGAIGDVKEANSNARRILYEKLLNWEEATVQQPINITESMKSFMELRSHLNKLTGWL